MPDSVKIHNMLFKPALLLLNKTIKKLFPLIEIIL